MTHCTNNTLTCTFCGTTVAHSLNRDLLSPANVAQLNTEIDLLHKDQGKPMEWEVGAKSTETVWLRGESNWRERRHITFQHWRDAPMIDRLVQETEGEEYTIGGNTYYSFNINVKMIRYLKHQSNAHHDSTQNNTGAKIHYRQLIRLDSH